MVLILILLHNNNECSASLIIIMELKRGLRIRDNNELFFILFFFLFYLFTMTYIRKNITVNNRLGCYISLQ